MKLDTNNHLHARDGKYTHKEHQEANLTLEAPRTMEESFRLKLETTRTFMETHGRKPHFTREIPGEGPLYSWINKIRSQDKNGTLTAQEREALQSLPFSLFGGTIDEERIKNLKELEGFYEEHGRWPIFATAKDDTEIRLGRLFMAVRFKLTKPRYEDLRNLVRTHLKPEAAAVLLRSASHKNGHDLQWDSRFAEFEAFLETHGRLPSRHLDPAGNSLANWFSEWRSNARAGTIPADRLERLQALPLFKDKEEGIFYDFRLDHWDEHRQELCQKLTECFERNAPASRYALTHDESLDESVRLYIERASARKRDGRWVAPELEELLTKHLGAGWEGKKPKRSTVEVTERLREFVKANGRKPSAFSANADEASLGKALKSRAGRSRRGKPLDAETWTAMNEIFGKGWDARTRIFARDRTTAASPHPSLES